MENIAERPASRGYVVPLVIGLGVLLLVVAAVVVGGELAAFVLTSVMAAPIALLAALAYGGIRNVVVAVFAYIALGVVGFGALFFAFAYLFLALVADFNLLSAMSKNPQLMQQFPPNELVERLFVPGAIPTLLWGALLFTFVAIFSLTLLFRPVRMLVSRVIPIDPDNFVHKIALVFLTLVLFGFFVPIIVLGGRPPLLEAINHGALENREVGVRPMDQVYQFIWTVPAVLVAAGWPVIRNWRGALVRLGMVRPSRQQVGMAVAVGLVMAGVVGLGVDPLIHQMWTALGWPTTDAVAFERILAQLITPAGAVIIGVTAGVGEEMAVRGLLQPRIGLIASNLVFTSLHSLQYGFDGVLSVFLVGLVLGVIRNRTNTTTSAIVHGVYDFVLVMAAVVLAQP
jgi:membrane protease YdiL (CAAX protease family)